MGVKQVAILLCCSLWEDALGNNVHSHLGCPETCSPPQADIKSVDKAWSGLSLTYCCCVVPLGNYFCDSLTAILFSPLPLDDMEVAFSAALNSLLRGGGTWLSSFTTAGQQGHPCDLANPSVYPQGVSAHSHFPPCYFSSLPSPVQIHHNNFNFSWSLSHFQSAKVFLLSA